MSKATASRHAGAPPERSPEWRERAGWLYLQLRRPARAMIRRAFRGAFGDDEIEDIYSNAWLGTLRALERRHDELSDEEVRKYVLTAVANHASKELRRRSRRPTAPLEAIAAIPDGRTPPDEWAEKLEDSRITRDLLATLPSRRRAVMVLRYGWGLEPRQVCEMVRGLSLRAYRKEITRGVDELTQKLGLLERGEWCADRAPVLKAYAAGLANAEQQRQARQHLSHCRQCAEFVGRLSGHLHDIGSSVAALGGADAMNDGRLSLADRVADLAHRVRESAGHVLAGRPADGTEDVVSRVASLPGGARGAGAAGTGVLAKLAGLGTAGKLVAVCAGGGAAATACLAAGIVPADLRAPETRTTPNPAAVQQHVPASPSTPAVIPPSLGNAAPQPPPPASGEEPAGARTSEPPPAAEPEATPAIAPSAPPGEQEFGVASVRSVPGGSGGSSSGGGGASAIQREFGP